MAFKDKLRELMAEKNMKAVDLAKAAELSEAAISDYLKGKKEPRGRQSIAIAGALDVSLDTLWETGFQEKESLSHARQCEADSLTAAKLDEALRIFKALTPDYQDFALEQMKKLIELQDKK